MTFKEPGRQRQAGQTQAAVPQAENQVKAGGKEPLYLQLSRVLKEEIVNGLYPVGSLLPTEDSLCKRFSVSRHTVRESLRLLRDDGLVASRQGAGTAVIPPRSSTSDTHQVMSINDLLAFGRDARFEIDSISMMDIDPKTASRTGLPTGEQWLQVIGYRRTEDVSAPFCWTEYYINRKFGTVGRLLPRHIGPIFPLLEDMFGLSVTEVNQQISATLIAPTLADGLEVKEGSAGLEVRRTYRTADGEIAQVTINTHPASRFQHSMTMRRVRT